MRRIYVREIIDEKGNKVIELDLNKPWPRSQGERYASSISQLGKIGQRAPKKMNKEFITILN